MEPISLLTAPPIPGAAAQSVIPATASGEQRQTSLNIWLCDGYDGEVGWYFPVTVNAFARLFPLLQANVPFLVVGLGCFDATGDFASDAFTLSNFTYKIGSTPSDIIATVDVQARVANGLLTAGNAPGTNARLQGFLRVEAFITLTNPPPPSVDLPSLVIVPQGTTVIGLNGNSTYNGYCQLPIIF